MCCAWTYEALLSDVICLCDFVLAEIAFEEVDLATLTSVQAVCRKNVSYQRLG